MGVLMQAFYWDCPREKQQEHAWWNFVASKLDELRNAGFSAPWLPPASKGANLAGMSDLCHINPRVSTGILNHAKWMIQEIGFDGFRYDFVKGFGTWIVRAIHDRQYTRDKVKVDLFGVGECWAGDDFIDSWLDSVNRWADNRVGAFDFPLRYRLKDLCDLPGFSLRTLANGGVLMKDRPFEAVTFVDNHDFRGGGTNILYVDDLFYAMERSGAGSLPGLVFPLNNSGEVIRQRVKTGFPGKALKPLAWRAKEMIYNPQSIIADADGWCEVEAPRRGYVVYGV